MKEGYLTLGGKQLGVRLRLIDEKPANIPTSLWGQHGWSTWCYNLEEVIKEAIASNSRGPTLEVDKQVPIHWLIMEMEVPLCKLPYLLMKGLVTTGNERNNIFSLRLHGNIPGSWISVLHMAVQWEMTHKTWADIKLSDWHVKTDGYCTTCGAKGATWDAHCATCWVKYMASKRHRVSLEAGRSSLMPP